MATCVGDVGNAPERSLNGLRSRAIGDAASKPTPNGGLPCVSTTLPFLSVSFASPLISGDANATDGTARTFAASDPGIDLRCEGGPLSSLVLNAVLAETTASALPYEA